ncbi:MAG: Aspartate carbamoyltransferase regulatory chain [Chlamydiae bacterium]|nr:Aspartate carbamoyltransferase regulatory chain [Chlamydiota bacterium]
MRRELSVAAIENGTVIDHIPAGKGLRIAQLLQLAKGNKTVTLGLNLPSQSMGYKDLIKVEGKEISEREASLIALFAPNATISLIRAFERVEKFSVILPKEVENFLSCPNKCCLTSHEPIKSRFEVFKKGSKVELVCYYCEKGFFHDED